jgi:hypothetical protein
VPAHLDISNLKQLKMKKESTNNQPQNPAEENKTVNPVKAEKNKKTSKENKKNSSAMIAASRARSVINNTDVHRKTRLLRDLSVTGTNDSYGEDL